MITQNDIDLLEQTFVTKDDLKEKLNSFKSDLLDKLDEILKEILASREEQTILAHKVFEHEDRISKLEKVAKAN